MPELFRLISGSDPIRFADAPERLVELLRNPAARQETLRAITYLLSDIDEIRLRTLDVLRQVFERADAAAFDGLTRLVGAGLCDEEHRLTIEEALKHGLTAPSRECQSGASRLLLRLLGGPAAAYQAEQQAAWDLVARGARAERVVVRRAFAELLGRLVVITASGNVKRTTSSRASMAKWVWADELDYPNADAWAGVITAAALFASNRQVRGRAAMNLIAHVREADERGDAAVQALIELELPKRLERSCGGDPDKLEALWLRQFPSYGVVPPPDTDEADREQAGERPRGLHTPK